MRLLLFVFFLAFFGAVTPCCNNNIASHAMRTNFNPLLEKCPTHALFSCKTTVILNGKPIMKDGNQIISLFCNKRNWSWTHMGIPVKRIECR
ncbi:hypothetical protein PRIPAC_92089 [Pristionchus pacificus]|uniref:Uncharacterized protein n=1 Tax=Pristionchus pacificus TaxID=54126 RepID=A0A2A6BQR2_PRIPA|nr:hypothetical protein PRIPAC_92089 [Pristionchus pacificus]|eukprot:PDM68260.1 hypothetical protein PRIPAC_46304 [Pristionchus pacificus]